MSFLFTCDTVFKAVETPSGPIHVSSRGYRYPFNVVNEQIEFCKDYASRIETPLESSRIGSGKREQLSANLGLHH